MPPIDATVSKFRVALEAAYGPRIERVVLYGSRARGDAKQGSDYDVARFLRDIVNRWEEFGTLADIELNLLDATGEAVHVMPYPAGSWRDPASPIMYEIRRDGIDL